MRISDWSSDVCSSDLVHRMGGELELESVPGTGSTFRFELRLARTTPEPALPATEPRRIVRGKRILVADDNRTNLVLIGEMLESDKHQVISVASGHGALAPLASADFDVVFLDFHLQDIHVSPAYEPLRFALLQTSPPP